MSAHQYPGQYFVLFVAVALVWAWLAGSSVYGWRQRVIGVPLAVTSLVVWTGIAGLVLLFVGPYWRAVYLVLLQPG